MSIGSQDEKRLESALGASFAITAGMALILCQLSSVLLKPLMVWLNTPAELNDMMGAYLRVILCGIPAVGIYNFFAAYLRSKGDSETPLLFLALSAALNIALDLLFVIVFKIGIAGAAIATLIAEVLSAAVIAGYSLHSDAVLKTALWPLKTDRQALAEIADYSFLTCLQQSVMNLGILMVQEIDNGFGPTVMAAFAAGVKIDAFAYMPAQEYGNAFSTFVAQNRGAEKKRRMLQGFRVTALTSLGYCLIVSLILWFLAENLLEIFIDGSETQILQEGIRYLHVIAPFYAGIGLLILFYGWFRAAGRPGISVLLTILSLGTRVILSAFLSRIPEIGVTGIWWSIPIGWGIADLAGILLLLTDKKKLQGI